MGVSDPDALRAEILERWERAAAGWGKHAERMREFGMPVSAWMIDHAGLQPGQRVLELAAGPGDTGFLAAELIRPGGTLISSDATEAMLEVARARAAELGDRERRVQAARARVDRPRDRERRRRPVQVGPDVQPSIPRPRCGRSRRVLRPGGRARAGRVGRAAGQSVGHDPDPGAGRARAHDAARSRRARECSSLAGAGRLQESARGRPGSSTCSSSRSSRRARSTSVEEYVAETHDLSSMFGEMFDRAFGRGARGGGREDRGARASRTSGADGSLSLPAQLAGGGRRRLSVSGAPQTA